MASSGSSVIGIERLTDQFLPALRILTRQVPLDPLQLLATLLHVAVQHREAEITWPPPEPLRAS
jgi:hypothetical protein